VKCYICPDPVDVTSKGPQLLILTLHVTRAPSHFSHSSTPTVIFRSATRNPRFQVLHLEDLAYLVFDSEVGVVWQVRLHLAMPAIALIPNATAATCRRPQHGSRAALVALYIHQTRLFQAKQGSFRSLRVNSLLDRQGVASNLPVQSGTRVDL
jgi:hypothetical protein